VPLFALENVVGGFFDEAIGGEDAKFGVGQSVANLDGQSGSPWKWNGVAEVPDRRMSTSSSATTGGGITRETARRLARWGAKTAR